jgi:hypothetical protein
MSERDIGREDERGEMSADAVMETAREDVRHARR